MNILTLISSYNHKIRLLCLCETMRKIKCCKRNEIRAIRKGIHMARNIVKQEYFNTNGIRATLLKLMLRKKVTSSFWLWSNYSESDDPDIFTRMEVFCNIIWSDERNFSKWLLHNNGQSMKLFCLQIFPFYNFTKRPLL